MLITAVCGSLQSASLNLELLQAIKSYVAHPMHILDAELLDLPLFRVEHFGHKELRSKLVEAKTNLHKADLIIIGSPEYNGSVSGVLKNFIDWLSVDIQDDFGRNPFRGKKVAIVSASTSPFGGIRSMMHMRDIMLSLGSNLMSQNLCISTKYHPLNAAENLLLIEGFSKSL